MDNMRKWGRNWYNQDRGRTKVGSQHLTQSEWVSSNAGKSATGELAPAAKHNAVTQVATSHERTRSIILHSVLCVLLVLCVSVRLCSFPIVSQQLISAFLSVIWKKLRGSLFSVTSKNNYWILPMPLYKPIWWEWMDGNNFFPFPSSFLFFLTAAGCVLPNIHQSVCDGNRK